MKRCPKCQCEYTDETLNFCLDDGEWLREVSESDEPATAILHETDAPGAAATRAQIHTTNQADIPPAANISHRSRRFDKKLVIVAVVLALIGVGAFIG